jgi:hypothetical protein
MEGAAMTREIVDRPIDEWGALLRAFLSHDLVRFLAAAHVEILSDPDGLLVLEEGLRPFVELKVELESTRPHADELQAIHDELTQYAKRIVNTVHVAILNSIEANKESKRIAGEPLRLLRAQTEPRRRLHLEWQLNRMHEARLQLLRSLAQLDETNRHIFEQLNLTTEAISHIALINSLRRESGL